MPARKITLNLFLEVIWFVQTVFAVEIFSQEKEIFEAMSVRTMVFL